MKLLEPRYEIVWSTVSIRPDFWIYNKVISPSIHIYKEFYNDSNISNTVWYNIICYIKNILNGPDAQWDEEFVFWYFDDNYNSIEKRYEIINHWNYVHLTNRDVDINIFIMFCHKYWWKNLLSHIKKIQSHTIILKINEFRLTNSRVRLTPFQIFVDDFKYIPEKCQAFNLLIY